MISVDAHLKSKHPSHYLITLISYKAFKSCYGYPNNRWEGGANMSYSSTRENKI